MVTAGADPVHNHMTKNQTGISKTPDNTGNNGRYRHKNNPQFDVFLRGLCLCGGRTPKADGFEKICSYHRCSIGRWCLPVSEQIRWRTIRILCRFSVDLIPIRPWNYSKIWWNSCWIRSVIKNIFNPSDHWLRMCLNRRKMRSLYRNSTDIQRVLSKRPSVWM